MVLVAVTLEGRLEGLSGRTTAATSCGFPKLLNEAPDCRVHGGVGIAMDLAAGKLGKPPDLLSRARFMRALLMAAGFE